MQEQVTERRAVSPEWVPGVAELARKVAAAVGGVIVGKPEVIQTTIITMLAGGHLLIEDVPGVGKTTLAVALARSVAAEVTRIQFTSDMLPTDVTGVSVFDQSSREFRFHRGPIFTNVLIGDEVNRATPKTQSALLEAMGENHVSVDGVTYPLSDPFMVVATQNPQDMEGTFPLPEAQRDRFMARISLGYPGTSSELDMVTGRSGTDPLEDVIPVVGLEDLLTARQVVGTVHLSDRAAGYLVAIVEATRSHPAVHLGASPRSSLHLARMARARAASLGRTFVSPDDVATLAAPVLAHRLLLRGRFASVTEELAEADRVVRDIVAATPMKLK